MSNRDRGLLEAAGVSVPDAAELLGRSRPALYQALAQDRDCLTTNEVAMIVHEAIRKDSPRMDSLAKYISHTYSPEICGKILWDRISIDKFRSAVRDASEITVVYNGNSNHLFPGSVFMHVLDILLNEIKGVDAHFVLPNDWVVSYFRKNYPQHQIVRTNLSINQDAMYQPSFVMIKTASGARVFVFLKRMLEELPAADADQVWMRFSPRQAA